MYILSIYIIYIQYKLVLYICMLWIYVCLHSIDYKVQVNNLYLRKKFNRP